MTLEAAIRTLNRNTFWGYATWHTEQRGNMTFVLAVPGGYTMLPETAIGFAIMHPHDDGRVSREEIRSRIVARPARHPFLDDDEDTPDS